MKTKRISMMITILFSMVATWAQNDDYITEVMLIGGDKSEVNSMIDSYTDYHGLAVDHNFTVFRYDLNRGAGGKYIYLLCKYRSAAPSWMDPVPGPVTDIYLRVCDSKPDPIPQTLTHNGHTYQLARLGGNDDFNNQGGDLNYSVGGKYIYLYYTKEDLIPGRKIRSIHFDGNSDAAVGKNGTYDPCDLNEGAGGDYVYMHLERFRTDADFFDVTTEGQLKDAVTLDYANIRLAANITLTKEVVIQDGRTITIDLNGKTLNRGLSSPTNYGHVLKVLSGNTLTVLDSSGNNSGSIRGGYTNNGGAINNLGTFILNGGTIEASSSTNYGAGIWNQSEATATINGGVIQNCTTTSSSGKGGGIYNQGTLTINDCTIQSNTCEGRGGGIYNQGTLTINGGTIQNNTCNTNGGGIYDDGELFMQASPIVNNNTKGNAANNVYLPNGKVINVSGAFTTDANIGITPQSENSVLTSFYANDNANSLASDYFFVDAGNRYAVQSSGEVYEGLYWTSGAATCTLNLNDVFYIYGPGAMSNAAEVILWALHKDHIQSVVVDDGVTSIRSQCFSGFTNITDISIGRGVTTIGSQAFYGCTSLETFTIPANVTSIGEGAFYQCGTDVYCYANPNYLTVDDGLQGSFKDGKATHFHVLSSFLKAYQAKFPNANVTWVGDLVQTDTWTDEGNYATSFSNENGNTITIMNEAELARIAYMVNQKVSNFKGRTVKLNRDLHMSAHQWVPIAEPFLNNIFEGTFDGQGHTISGIVVNRSGYNYNGLFGWLGVWDGEFVGTVKNLRMTDCEIKGRLYSGAIAGVVQFVTVENCFIDASVSVSGYDYTGGIVGKVKGSDNFQKHWAHITHCLFAGNVTNTESMKGAVCGDGYDFYTTGSFFTNSSLKDFSADADHNVLAIPISTGTEGIHLNLGANDSISYNGTTYVATNGSATLTVVSDDHSERITSVKINGTQVGTNGGPHTLNMIADATACVVTATKEKVWTASGTADDPYTIGSLDEWEFFVWQVNNGMTFKDKYIVLTADIDNITTMAGSTSKSFQGTFDGQNHKLTASFNSYADCGALFPNIKDAVIKRLHVDGDITVGKFGAALVGQADGSNLIEDVKVTANVTMHPSAASNPYLNDFQPGASGVVGHVLCSTLTMRGVVFSGKINCITSGPVFSGGLIGWIDGNATLTLQDCLSCGIFYNGEYLRSMPWPFHPIAIRDPNKTINTTVSNVLYTTEPVNNEGFDEYIIIPGMQATVSNSCPEGIFVTSAYNMLTAYQAGIFYNGKYYLLPVIELANNADNSQTINDNANKTCAVKLAGRSLYFDRDWKTLCLPFNIDAQQLAFTPLAGATLMAFDGSTSAFEETSGTLTLNFSDATTVEAGQPYLMKWKNGLTITDGTPGLNGAVGAGALSYLTDGIIDPGDGTSKKWCAKPSKPFGSWFVEFSTAAPISISSYTMSTGNDTETHPERNPKVWTLKAKLNASDEWTTIDSRNAGSTPADAMPTTNFTSKSYDVTTSGNYRYFRLDITENGGKDENNDLIVQLSEFSINGRMDNPIFSSVTIDSSNPVIVSSSDEKVSFTGAYKPVNITATGDNTKLFLDTSNNLYWPSNVMIIGAQQAYFQLNGITAGEPSNVSSVYRFVMNLGDETITGTLYNNGIATSLMEKGIVNSEESATATSWYSIDGQKLSGKPTKRGVYIQNGKKVVVK